METCIKFGVCITLLILIVFGVGWFIQTMDRDKARALQAAPREYNDNREQLQRALPDCKYILLEEAKRDNSYKTGSSSVKAREKCIRLIRRALTNALLLHNHDINRGTYTAVEELERIKTACANCLELNKEKRNPVCRALTQQTGTIEAELQFNGSINNEVS